MRFHLYEVPRLVKFKETESRMGVPGAGGEEVGSYCLLRAEFQFCKTERVPEMDNGHGCTTVLNAIQLYT